jgi:hypothetical protein
MHRADDLPGGEALFDEGHSFGVGKWKSYVQWQPEMFSQDGPRRKSGVPGVFEMYSWRSWLAALELNRKRQVK